MNAHYAEIAGHIYIYKDGASYEQRSEFECIMTVTWRGPHEAWVSAAKGEINIGAVKALLAEKGARVIHYEHRGKLRTLRA